MEYKETKSDRIERLAREITKTAAKSDLDPFDVMQAMGHAQATLGMVFGINYKTEQKDGEELREAIGGFFKEALGSL